jgi:hypothetical protein
LHPDDQPKASAFAGSGSTARQQPASAAVARTELADHSLVADASAQVRVYSGAVTFRLCIVNRSETFFGFTRPLSVVSLDGEPVMTFDLMGKDVAMFHYTADDPAGTVGQAQAR